MFLFDDFFFGIIEGIKRIVKFIFYLFILDGMYVN